MILYMIAHKPDGLEKLKGCMGSTLTGRCETLSRLQAADVQPVTGSVEERSNCLEDLKDFRAGAGT